MAAPRWLVGLSPDQGAPGPCSLSSRPFVHGSLRCYHQAEDAAKYYVSIFNNSKIDHVSRYGEDLRQSAGTVLAVDFTLEGQEFVALNCGPMFKFTPAISLLVDCATPEEVDELWSKLSAVPEAEGCGWCQDQFGVTWQIVPSILGEMTRDKDSKKADAVLQALNSMKKIDSRALQEAYDRAIVQEH